MNKPKVTLTYKLCESLMDDLACLCYSVTGDIALSDSYAKSKFLAITKEWENLNGFEFEILEEDCD